MNGSGQQSPDGALLELLESARGSESPALEFKLDLRLDSRSQKAEFAKDIALQANLPTGGSVVFGVDDNGKVVGLVGAPPKSQIENVLVNRLMFPPPTIDILECTVKSGSGEHVPVIWIRVAANSNGPITCFRAEDSTWKLPRRVGTATRYLDPAEAIVVGAQAATAGATSPLRPPKAPLWDRPDTLTEIMESNLFPVIRLPNTLWQAPTDVASSGEVRRRVGERCPPFVVGDGHLYSLRSDEDCLLAFSSFIKGPSAPVQTRRLLKRHSTRRQLIGLLNQELVDFCLSRGLAYDPDKERIYFRPIDGKPIKVDWQSYKTRASRTVAGPRQTKEGVTLYWYHLAARISIVDLEDSLSVAINPTWVFSADSVRLIEGVRVGPIAGRKMAFEDNARVRYNVRFWIRYLSEGAERIRLPLRAGGLVIRADSQRVTLPAGIAEDRQSVTVDEGGSSNDVPEPIPFAGGDTEHDNRYGSDEGES